VGSRKTALLLLVVVAAASACVAGTFAAADVSVPPPTIDDALAAAPGKSTAVVAGGCFWGVQLVFQHVRGVTHVTSGYAGGAANTAHYESVETGETGHAESVEVTYDPSKITYGQLLRIFFAVAHDPTQLNRQGPDTGKQYRSVIFTSGDSQAPIARAYVDQLNKANTFGRTVVTEVAALPHFYPAEAEHQDYATIHPDDPYIRYNDAPKLDRLRQVFPDLFVAAKAR
jgi:peptide-methionine (S)-S-oxide reductase